MSCPCEAAEAPWCPVTTAHERGRGGRGPQAPVALNLEHWYKISWKNRSSSGFFHRNLVNWRETNLPYDG